MDTKIETLLRDWHHNPDLLFSIHPIDGSFLIWHIEWLDEYHPGSFRQAQISFSTRIPNAFPLGDASTMSHSVSMYSHNTGGPLLNIREVAKSSTKPSNEGKRSLSLSHTHTHARARARARTHTHTHILYIFTFGIKFNKTDD